MIVLEYYLSLLDTQEEKDKLELIFNEYGKRMKKKAYGFFGNESDAEDAVSESILKIINILNKIKEPICHETQSLIVIIVKNTCRDMLRKRKRNPVFGLEEFDYEPAVTKVDFYENLSKEFIRDEIKKLPEIYRDVVMLKAFYHLHNKYIAEILCVNENTVRKRLERAREKLEYLKKGRDKR